MGVNLVETDIIFHIVLSDWTRPELKVRSFFNRIKRKEQRQ